MLANIQPIVAKNQQLIRVERSARVQPMVVDDSKSGFAARLNEALDDAEIPERKRRKTLAGWCGVSREAARKWLSGESRPETKRIDALAKYLDVNGEWLLTNRGPKRSSLVDRADSVTRFGVADSDVMYRPSDEMDPASYAYLDPELLVSIKWQMDHPGAGPPKRDDPHFLREQRRMRHLAWVYGQIITRHRSAYWEEVERIIRSSDWETEK